jgi:hypothetical protein
MDFTNALSLLTDHLPVSVSQLSKSFQEFQQATFLSNPTGGPRSIRHHMHIDVEFW